MTHPVVKDNTTTYWIDFKYLSYLRYFFYQWEILNRLNYVNEEKLTKSMIASTQAKIDKAMEESQRMIAESLNRQKDIILRLDGDVSDKSS